MKIRIVDIAKIAGVSAGTVDRVIHQRGRYSEKTKEKVDKAIKELGYSPDLMARNLALKKELLIVCMLPNPTDTPYWERPYAGVEKAINELYSFKVKVEKILFTPKIEDFKKTYQQVLELNPDGVVYVPMFLDESALFAKELDENNIPFVHFNIYQPAVKPLFFVGQDPIAAGKTAASLCHLALKNEQNILIAYISEEKQEYSHLQERINGFLQYFEDKNHPTIHHLDIKINNSESNYDNKLIGYLEENNNIQIIYVPNSRVHKIASILKNHHRKDIMVVGFDMLKENITYLKNGYIDFLIGQQSQYQGFNAVMLLFNALSLKPPTGPQQFLPIDIINKENADFYEGLMSK